MDAGVQPDSPQHYSVDADNNDSPLDMNPGGQINASGTTAAVTASIQSIMPVTYTQPTNYNPPPPNNAQWPLTYAMTPLPEASTHVEPTPLISVTSPAEISQVSVSSPELSHGGKDIESTSEPDAFINADHSDQSHWGRPVSE